MAVILYLFIGILSLILLFLFDYMKNIRFYKQAAKIPGPKALPILGNALHFIGKDSSDAFYTLWDLFESFASPSRFWLLNQFWVGIYEPDQMKTVLSSPKSMEKSDLYNKFSRHLWGNSLLSAPVPIWRAHRKLIQPTFNPQTLRTFLQIFDKYAKSLVEKMEEELGGGEFSVAPYFKTVSIKISLDSTMGISESSDSKMYRRYTECVDRSTELAMARGYRIWLHSDIIFNLTKMSKDFYKCVNWMRSTVLEIIANKKIELVKPDEIETDDISNTRKGFLGILLSSEDKKILSDEDVCDEANLMVVAAYETVATTLQYIMLLLASYPEVQEKVYRELIHIYGEVIPENVSITTEDLKQMDYTERVIKESLRVFPTVPFVLRKVEEDLDIGGYTLPKGTTALCFIMKVHRNEKYWPDPLKFDPDRFLPEEVGKRNPNCYMPFSAGPRNCIGATYAMMEMKTIVSRIVLKYVLKKKNIQPIFNIKQRLDVVSHPVEPVTIEIVKRLPNTSSS